MTRIIAGDFRGRALRVPPTVTRPTSSRVREAVFSSVQHAMAGFSGLAVLDLFAGSGALGIEALSRGADHAVFVESDAGALATIRTNLTACETRAGTLVRADALAHTATPAPEPFDVVFADPPYKLSDAECDRLLTQLVAGGWLADGAMVVLERGKGAKVSWPAEITDTANRAYGDTVIWYGHYERP
jgi:16S rRNA (guanine966-N2)-methyltransferase